MVDFAPARATMVDTQVRPADVTRFPVIEAMLTVPREVFVPAPRRAVAYAGENVPLPGGRVLLDPRTIGKMIDALDIQPRDLVLDVGCGTGYAAALIGRMAGAVVALEDDPARAAEAEAALAAAGADNVAVVSGPLASGWAEQAPYDVILISGGAVETVPETLTVQLAEGGRIAALFVEGALGTVCIGLATGGQVTWRRAFNAHAPLLPEFVRPRGFVL